MRSRVCINDKLPVNNNLSADIFSFASRTTKFACADTGSTNLLLRHSDASGVVISRDLESISVVLPNGTQIQSISCGHFHFHNLPVPITAYIFPDTSLHTSLLSISELCNAGCLATFDANSFQLTYNDLPVIQGFKHADKKLWSVSLLSTTCDNNSNPQCNATKLTSDASFVSFVHTSLGNPVFSTFIQAVRAGYLNSWPRLSTAIVLAHPPHTIATPKGHLNQHRQGMDSTKTDSTILTIPISGSDTTNLDIVEVRASLSPEASNHAYVKIIQIPHTVSADLTG